MESADDEVLRVAGRGFTRAEAQVVTHIVADGQGASRAQLMKRVCRHLDRRRASGALKVRECRDVLERLQQDGWLQLPPKRATGRPLGSRTRVPHTARGEPGPALVGTVAKYGPVHLERV